ncbi:MAG: acyl-CoA thioesterase [Acidimicrobiia bacterium]
MPFVHHVRPRYAEVDAQGVVFNAHWLTYFDEACTRFFEDMGFPPAEAFFRDFDLMVVKATIEWQGPAGFDEHVDVAVGPSRLGTSSLDIRYTATVGERAVCVGTITYVSVKPGTHDAAPIPTVLREKLEAAAPS